LSITENLQEYGAKIDGVGMQTHLAYNKTPTADTLTNIMIDFTALDVDVAVTEMDVRLDMTKISSETKALQTQGFANVVKACKDVQRCVGVTVWDFTDKYSWCKKNSEMEVST
jgi:endo-1,4-beta-xylanase